MPRPWILMSPSSRGIGLHMTRRILQNTSAPVVATARKGVEDARREILEGLDGVDEDRLHVLALDVLGMPVFHHWFETRKPSSFRSFAAKEEQIRLT